MADSVENFLYKCCIAVLGCDFGWHGHLGRDCSGDSRIARFVIPAEAGIQSWKRSTSFQLVNKIASRSDSTLLNFALLILNFYDTWHWDEAAAKSYQEIVESGGRVCPEFSPYWLKNQR